MKKIFIFIFFLCFAFASIAQGQSDPSGFQFNVSMGQDGAETDFSMLIQILVVMTIVSLGPAIVLMMTSFLRITIVLSFLRTAIGLQSTPSNQIIIGISLFLTFFLMTPVWNKIQTEALQPYQNEQITSSEALAVSTAAFRDFMLKQTRPSDIEFFLQLSGSGPISPDQIPISVMIPSFVFSELRTAFQMGFLIFLPFLVIDFVVASSLMAMGMFMMPPVIVSLPFKLLLFVLVDGWHLVARSLIQSFNL